MTPLTPARRCAAAACLLLVCLALAAPVQRAERVRVMTYNIHHGAAADGRLDLDAIAGVIRSARVDVVGLQEVDRHWAERSAHADQVRELADRLGMHAFFAPIYDLPPAAEGRPRREYGLAVLSRFPIAAARNHPLTRLPTTGDTTRPQLLPGFPHVTVDMRGTPLHVLATHLDYRADPSVRAVQVRETVAILARLQGPAVLVGDFNAPPGAGELRPLRPVVVDAWASRGSGPGNTYPAAAPTRRIDHVYVTPDIRVAAVEVPEAAASDHRPVVAELLVPRRGR